MTICLESTNAGKTLPPCMFPYVIEEINRRGVCLIENPKCIFLTALNSIKDSLAKNMCSIGLAATVLTSDNCKEVLKSKTIRVFFVSPETLWQKTVVQELLSVRDSIVLKCIDEVHLFIAWGVEKKGIRTFRPAMQLSSGELASLGGITLLQTATASSKTIRLIEDEFPEISTWTKILNVPFRSNVSIIIPPSKCLPSNYRDTLAPFVTRIRDYGESHLFIVRSINSGTEVYFTLIAMLGEFTNKKSVAFYHSNSSDGRKSEILYDLALPTNSPEKILKAVVSTISLGVGVDIRVNNVVCFGLGSTPENLIQEAGRCNRGKEGNGGNGLAFFFQKGSIAALHCPPSSDCRTLVKEPLPVCQTKSLFQHFDPEFEVNLRACDCCFSCRSNDANIGCDRCALFLETYIPRKTVKVKSASLRKGLKLCLLDLFEGLGIKEIPVETRLTLEVHNFVTDFVRAYDEIDNPEDVQSLWHIPKQVAQAVHDVSKEFLDTQCSVGIDALDEATGEKDVWDEDESDFDFSDAESDSTSGDNLSTDDSF